MTTLRYRVLVDDNFHYMDESERYNAGSFATAEEAIECAKRIVDSFLVHSYQTGITKEKLFQQYKNFGDDPFISPAEPSRDFSAWDYARDRCRQICEEGKEATGRPIARPRQCVY